MKRSIKLGDWLFNDELYEGRKYQTYIQACKKEFRQDKLKERRNNLLTILRTDGRSVTKIAQEQGVPFQTLYRWIKEYDIKRPTISS